VRAFPAEVEAAPYGGGLMTPRNTPAPLDSGRSTRSKLDLYISMTPAPARSPLYQWIRELDRDAFQGRRQSWVGQRYMQTGPRG
jgi:hypothetical protein